MPDTAFAGGPTVYWNTDPPAPKLDKQTGRPVVTVAETRDKVRDKLLDKMDRRAETMARGAGLGNWLEPVMELGGKVVEHNPFTDAQGNIAREHERGDARTTAVGTPWDKDDDLGTIHRGDVATDLASARRAADVARIKFAPQVDKREFAGDQREIIVNRATKDIDQRHRELGPFEGYKEHTTDEISKLASRRNGYRDSAREGMYEKMMS